MVQSRMIARNSNPDIASASALSLIASADCAGGDSTVTVSVDVSEQIKVLVQAVDRGTCQLLLLLPAFDRQMGWSANGYRSCTAWLNAQCGMSPSAANDRLRAGYALEKLPVIRQLFELGELSWSKVRALTRIATPENERELASRALEQSASEIERSVRRYRFVQTQADINTEDDLAERQYQNRYLNYWFDDRGMVRVHGALPPLEGAAFMKSLARAEDVLYHEAGIEQLDSKIVDRSTQRSARQLRADAMSLMAGQAMAAEDMDVRAADRYQVVVQVDAAVLHQTDENPNPKCACRSVDSPLRSYIDNGPAVSARTVRRLVDDCSVLSMVEMHGEPLSIGRKSRVWPTAISRAIIHRDEHCQFPGCDASRHLQLHHLKHWADGGETSVDNGLALCGFHHRLVHERNYTIEKTPLEENGQLPIRGTVIECNNGEIIELQSSLRRFRVRRSDGSLLE